MIEQLQKNRNNKTLHTVTLNYNEEMKTFADHTNTS